MPRSKARHTQRGQQPAQQTARRRQVVARLQQKLADRESDASLQTVELTTSNLQQALAEELAKLGAYGGGHATHLRVLQQLTALADLSDDAVIGFVLLTCLAIKRDSYPTQSAITGNQGLFYRAAAVAVKALTLNFKDSGSSVYTTAMAFIAPHVTADAQQYITAAKTTRTSVLSAFGDETARREIDHLLFPKKDRGKLVGSKVLADQVRPLITEAQVAAASPAVTP